VKMAYARKSSLRRNAGKNVADTLSAWTVMGWTGYMGRIPQIKENVTQTNDRSRAAVFGGDSERDQCGCCAPRIARVGVSGPGMCTLKPTSRNRPMKNSIQPISPRHHRRRSSGMVRPRPSLRARVSRHFRPNAERGERGRARGARWGCVTAWSMSLERGGRRSFRQARAAMHGSGAHPVVNCVERRRRYSAEDRDRRDKQTGDSRTIPVCASKNFEPDRPDQSDRHFRRCIPPRALPAC